MPCYLLICKRNIWKPEVYFTHNLAALRGKSWIDLSFPIFIKEPSYIHWWSTEMFHLLFTLLFYFIFSCLQFVFFFTSLHLFSSAKWNHYLSFGEKWQDWQSWNLPLVMGAEIALKINHGHTQAVSSWGKMLSQDRPYPIPLGWAGLRLPSYLGAYNYSTKMKVHLWKQPLCRSLSKTHVLFQLP